VTSQTDDSTESSSLQSRWRFESKSTYVGKVDIPKAKSVVYWGTLGLEGIWEFCNGFSAAYGANLQGRKEIKSSARFRYICFSKKVFEEGTTYLAG
jgi:hypothetical protein